MQVTITPHAYRRIEAEIGLQSPRELVQELTANACLYCVGPLYKRKGGRHTYRKIYVNSDLLEKGNRYGKKGGAFIVRRGMNGWLAQEYLFGFPQDPKEDYEQHNIQWEYLGE